MLLSIIVVADAAFLHGDAILVRDAVGCSSLNSVSTSVRQPPSPEGKFENNEISSEVRAIPKIFIFRLSLN